MERSRRSWGWHQLDDAWAERIVALAEVGAGDLVLDVGAGTGALTQPLVATGARVIAVERHPGRAAALRERFGDAIVVVTADATDLRLPRRPFHVVANPPFAITAPLLDRLVHPGSRMVRAHLVLQRQVVRRWVAEGAAGRPRWARTLVASPGPAVPRRAFARRRRWTARCWCCGAAEPRVGQLVRRSGPARRRDRGWGRRRRSGRAGRRSGAAWP